MVVAAAQYGNQGASVSNKNPVAERRSRSVVKVRQSFRNLEGKKLPMRKLDRIKSAIGPQASSSPSKASDREGGRTSRTLCGRVRREARLDERGGSVRRGRGDRRAVPARRRLSGSELYPWRTVWSNVAVGLGKWEARGLLPHPCKRIETLCTWSGSRVLANAFRTGSGGTCRKHGFGRARGLNIHPLFILGRGLWGKIRISLDEGSPCRESLSRCGMRAGG